MVSVHVCWRYFGIYLLHLEVRSLLVGNRKVSNWIVFREKSDSFLKCLWFNVDLWGFWWVERKCYFHGEGKCMLKMIYINFDCVLRREVFWLVNRNVSNWIVFREKSDSFLKCLWFSCDLWGFWRVERGCMLDGVRKCVLKMLQNIFDCV